jgi:hypothetical protein
VRPFTLKGIVTAWAPPSENDTEAYIADVAQRTGYAADQVLSCNQPTMTPVAKAISIHEVGSWEFTDTDLDQGMTMVFGTPEPLIA